MILNGMQIIVIPKVMFLLITQLSHPAERVGFPGAAV